AQTYVARLVLAAVGDPVSAAAQVRAHAQGRPDDDRLATLAETLTALTGPGRAPLRWMVSHPLHVLVTGAALRIALLLAVPAFRWNSWVFLSVVVTFVPTALLRTLLRRARDRAGSRPALAVTAVTAVTAETAGVPDLPMLPPVPASSRHEAAAAALVLTAVLAALVASGIWRYQQYTAYPRYTVAAPDSIQGYERLRDTTVQQFVDDAMGEDMAGTGTTSFSFVYGTGAEQQPGRPVFTVFGWVGDFHEMTPDTLASVQDSFRTGLSATGLTPEKTWSADPGRLGGTLRCLSYRAVDGQRVDVCTWGDKGSVGTVLSPASDRGPQAAANLARAVREAVLHQDTSADSA
ncbi:hypothetical protein GTY23_23560, partial [Streptomyces sp. SID5998]|nr:hypothetical protein [Streptomyces sp. SID5998]